MNVDEHLEALLAKKTAFDERKAKESKESTEITKQRAELFKKAEDIVNELKKELGDKLSKETLLNFYKYFKQSTVGDCNTTQPIFGMFVGGVKWNAWNGLKGMPVETAKESYIDYTLEVLHKLKAEHEKEKKAEHEKKLKADHEKTLGSSSTSEPAKPEKDESSENSIFSLLR